MHEEVKYPCKHCSYEATTKGYLQNTKCQFMNESNTLTNVAAMKQHKSAILRNTKRQRMKKSNFPANIAAMKQLQTEVLSDTKKLCIE